MEKKKLNYKEEQKKLKRNEKIKTGIYIGLLCLALGGFTLLTVCGAKSCHNKQHKSNTTRVIGDYSLRSEKLLIDEYPYKYYFRYQESFAPDNQDMSYMNISSGDTTIDGFKIRLKIVDNNLTTDNGYYLEIDNLGLDYISAYGDIVLYTQVENDLLVLYGVSNSQIDTCNIQVGFVDSTIDLYDTDNENRVLRFFANLMKLSSVVNLDLDFTFNGQINRYGILGQDNTFFGTFNSNYLGSKQVLKGYFKDNLDNYYTGITITYAQAQGTGYVDSTGYHVYDNQGLQYISLQYIKTNGQTVGVNYANYEQYDNKTVYTNQSRWIADSFRHLKIFYLDDITNSQLPINNYSPLEVLQMFNNSTGGDIGINGSTGVFGLLGQGFSSVASILNMQILPGISLGLFIFIPFSITILIACVWLFKR